MARVSLLCLPLAAPSNGRPGWPAIHQRLLPWLLPLSLFALWWLASRNLWMSEQILPAPALVWSSALELAHGELWSHLAISLQRLFWGLLAGIAAGALLGGFTAEIGNDGVETVLGAFQLTFVTVGVMAMLAATIFSQLSKEDGRRVKRPDEHPDEHIEH